MGTAYSASPIKEAGLTAGPRGDSKGVSGGITRFVLKDRPGLPDFNIPLVAVDYTTTIDLN